VIGSDAIGPPSERVIYNSNY